MNILVSVSEPRGGGLWMLRPLSLVTPRRYDFRGSEYVCDEGALADTNVV